MAIIITNYFFWSIQSQSVHTITSSSPLFSCGQLILSAVHYTTFHSLNRYMHALATALSGSV